MTATFVVLMMLHLLFDL